MMGIDEDDEDSGARALSSMLCGFVKGFDPEKVAAVVAEAGEERTGLLGAESTVEWDESEGWVASQSERSCSMGRWFMLKVPMSTTGAWFGDAMAAKGGTVGRRERGRGGEVTREYVKNE